MKRTALVTGAEGFIGSHLVSFLQAKGWNVIGGYRRTYGFRFVSEVAELRVCPV